jgi:PTS system nitrogen regulatory IIA component
MGNETMDLAQLASLLRRDQRELSKLASRGQLPGRKVGGDWRFARSEIRQWLETEMPGFDEAQLKLLEEAPTDIGEPLLTNLLAPACVEVPLPARTSASVIREMVRLAEQTWQVFDPEAILEAVKSREEMASTAQEGGVALLHPHRPLPNALGESVVAFGRTAGGIPFGGPRSQMTDLFFLDCCRDDRTHLRVLARLSRLILRPGFLDELRAAETGADALRVIREAEAALLAAD